MYTAELLLLFVSRTADSGRTVQAGGGGRA